VVQNQFEPELDLMEPVLLQTVVQVWVQQHRTLSVRSRFRFAGKVPEPDLNWTPATLHWRVFKICQNIVNRVHGNNIIISQILGPPLSMAQGLRVRQASSLAHSKNVLDERTL
jgi:hypothetical protein